MLNRLLFVLKSIWSEPSNRGQRVRRTYRFVAWQFRKRVLREPVEARLFNGLRIKVYPDCDTSPSALYYSLPNSVPVSFLRKHLRGGTLVDVGANVGMFSLLLADKVQHAILFEPNPKLIERVRENLRLNNLNYEVIAEALSDSSGTVEFENSANEMSCNRVVDGFTTSKATISVPRTTFDQFLRTRRAQEPPITAVKIDVEGHENSVLRGMREFLRNQRPCLVMFEYLQRTDIAQTISLFGEVGYFVFELSPAGPRAATKQVDSLQDLFACPSELVEEFGITTLSGVPRVDLPASESA